MSSLKIPRTQDHELTSPVQTQNIREEIRSVLAVCTSQIQRLQDEILRLQKQLHKGRDETLEEELNGIHRDYKRLERHDSGLEKKMEDLRKKLQAEKDSAEESRKSLEHEIHLCEGFVHELNLLRCELSQYQYYLTLSSSEDES
jgi:SMC interacting uncharacterized protein involved in chromosome segregation